LELKQVHTTEKNESKIIKFIEDTNLKFWWERTQNEILEKEVEFKVFVAWFNKHSDFNELQDEIISELKWEIIFDWTIKDVRYYDEKNKEESLLNHFWINLVRIREQKDFKEYKNTKKKSDIKIEDIYTIKKFDDEWYSDELNNINIDNNFWVDTLIWEYWLKEIKKSKKKRKEIKFFIKINWKEEEVKVAFDKYFDKDNSNIETFFEVEAKSEDIAKKWFEKILKLNSIKDKKISVTFKWAKLIKEEKKREINISNFQEIIEDLDNNEKLNKSDLLTKDIIESITDLLENQSIYISTKELLKNIESNTNFLYNQELKENFKVLLEKNLDIQLKKNPIFNKFFHRIITNDNPKKNPRKKFFDKFDREYSGYMKSFLNVIVKSFNNELIKNEDINKTKLIKKIITEKLDIFLKSIFMFDDSLTKEELEKVILLPSEYIKNSFKNYQEKILTIISSSEIDNQVIWQKNNINTNGNIELDNSRVLNNLLTNYSRAFSSVPQKNNEIWNEEIISNKLESIKLEQFSFLASSFSKWINSPNRDSKEFWVIKKLLLEDFYHIYILAKNDIAFKSLNSKEFNLDFIIKVIKKYWNVFLDWSNFLIEKEWPKLFEKLLTNILEEDDDELISQIWNEFIKFNKESNNNIRKYNNNEWLEEELINQLENKKLKFNEINFDNWSNLTINPRLKIFINKILKVTKNWIYLDDKFLKLDLDEYNTNLEKFLRIEFNKNNLDVINKNKKFLYYKISVKKQLEWLREYFKNNKLVSLNKEEKILYLVRNDINSFQLLVSWFQFNLKDKKQWSNIEDLSLYSQTFSEKILNNLWEEILDSDEIEFITTTSSAYNSTSKNSINRLIELHDRIGNDKSINANESFYFEKNWNKVFMKDYVSLFINKENEDYETYRLWIEFWIETVRDLMSWDTNNIDKDYYKILNKIWFPINDSKSLKKLLEFQKYLYKVVLPWINEIYNTWEESTNNFSKSIWDMIEKNKDYKHNKDYKIAENKSLYSMYRKSITKYWWNIEKTADWTRATIFWDNFEDLTNKMTHFIQEQFKSWNIKSIRFEDKIGNIFKKASRPNGYRDATLAITSIEWETVEVQFHFRPYYYIKTWNLKVEEKNNSKFISIFWKEYDIWKKIIEENITFSDKEKMIINDFCISTWKKLPRDFVKLFDFAKDNIWNEELQVDDSYFNADFTYWLERTIWNKHSNKKNESLNNDINIKLEKLDKILFDIADGEIAANELIRIMWWEKNNK